MPFAEEVKGGNVVRDLIDLPKLILFYYIVKHLSKYAREKTRFWVNLAFFMAQFCARPYLQLLKLL